MLVNPHMPASVNITNLGLATPYEHQLARGFTSFTPSALLYTSMTLQHEQDDLEGCVRRFPGTNVSTQGSVLSYKEASEPSSILFSLYIPSTWRIFFFVLAWSSPFSLYHSHFHHLVRRFLFAVT